MVDVKAARRGRTFTKKGRHSKSKKGKCVPVINVSWPVLAPSAVFKSLALADQLHRLTGAQLNVEVVVSDLRPGLTVDLFAHMSCSHPAPSVWSEPDGRPC